MRWSDIAAVVLLLASPAARTQQPTAPPFDLPTGLTATVVAESPALFNPTAMDVDAQGRIWVTEAVNYRRWDGRNPGRVHEAGDRVVVLEDTDGDGHFETSTVFAQDEDLVAPLGIAVIGERVYVSCSPTLWVYEDRDGDSRADHREALLTGFGGHDHDHGLHSVVFGPDGLLHFNTGNAGPHVVTDAAGWRLRSGSMYTGGGSAAADNRPGLRSDDGRVWTGGLALRVAPDGTGLTVTAHNFRNAYEVAVDAYGDLFQSDNDDDGNMGCRVLWCLEGGNHGYFSADGSRTWTADRRPGQSTVTAHWHQDDPGVVPAGAITGAGGPTGVAVYEGELLAPWIDGHVLAADAGRGVVFAADVTAEGAGFHLEPEVLIGVAESAEDDRARWFRPSDVTVDIDGGLLVADWYDPGVGGHQAGDGEAYGRILRIAPEGHGRRVPRRDVTTPRGAVDALRSPAVSMRALGWKALSEPGDENRAALLALADDEDPRLRARAVWLLPRHGEAGRVRTGAALADDDPRVRIAALRALRRSLRGPSAIVAVAARLVDDPSPAVRREVALALREVPADDRLDLLVELALAIDGSDRVALEALGLAADGVEAALWSRFAERLETDDPARWDERTAGVAWRLHPPAVVDALRARARDESLDAVARRRAVDALAFIPIRAAGEAMLELALAAPEDVRALAHWWVMDRDRNDWRDFDLAAQLAPTGIDGAELAFASGIVRRGTVDVAVDVTDAKAVWLVVDEGNAGNACDWADWIEPRFVVGDEDVRVTELPFLEATAAWGAVNVDANTVGDPLRIDGVVHPNGIGTHADSTVGVAVPPGATRFVARAGVDDGGTTQPGAPTEVEFRVYVERPPSHERLAALTAVVLDEMASPDDREEAAVELATDAEGGHVLLDLAAKGVLDEELEDVVAEEIFANPDLSVRALASEHFERPDSMGITLPPVSELLALDGDRRRGRDVFFAGNAQCATCHAVTRDGVRRGGDLGPELTSIADKFGRPEILDAILNPSAGIAFGYETWMLEDADGRILTGFLLSDGDDVVLRDTRGLRHVISADEIVSRRRQRLSTMPQGVALGLTPQQIADLLAFLMEDADRPGALGEEIALFNGRDLSGWTHHLNDPLATAADVWSVEDGVLLCKGWPIGYLRTERTFTSFVLTLEWRFDPAKGAGNSGVLLRLVGEDKVWPKSIEAQLHSGNAGDIWNIDAFDMDVAEDRTQGRRTQRSQPSSEQPLGEWNRYVITLDRGRLTLEVNGVLQNTAAWCAEVPGHIALQSEGAEIHFRNIRLREIHHDAR